MAKTAVATRSVDVDPIDRLEEKLKALVEMIERLRAENARQADENVKLTRELEAAHAQLVDAQASGADAASLREERDLIRTRVHEMLSTIEALNI